MPDKEEDYTLNNYLDHLETLQRFRDAELQRVAREPNMLLVMQQLADEFEGARQ